MKAYIGAVLVLALAGAVWALGGGDGGPAPPTPPGAGPPVAPDRGEGRIALWREGHPVALIPGTKGTTALADGFEGKKGSLRLGPNGRSLLVYLSSRLTTRPTDAAQRDHAYVRDGAATTEIAVEGVSLCHAFWDRGGGTVYGYGLALSEPRAGTDDPPPDLTADFVNWSFDLRTKKAARLKLPGNVSVLDVSPDGTSFLVLQHEKAAVDAGPPGMRAEPRPAMPVDYRLGVIPFAGGAFVPLTKPSELTPGDFRFSPDGRSALGTMYQEVGGRLFPDLVVFDLKMGTKTAVAVPKDARVYASCWSPDGKRIAYVWEPNAAYVERAKEESGPVQPGRPKKPRLTVMVARPDGSEAADVYTETEYWHGSIDWGVTPVLPVGPGVGPGEAARPRQPGGVFGDRLGEVHTIEGVRAEGGKVETGTLLVDTVDGKKLDRPVAIPVRGADPLRTPLDLPARTRCVLKGYELGEMIGRPPAEYALARERGQDPEELAKRDAIPWQWRPYFVPLLVVEPKGLEIPK